MVVSSRLVPPEQCEPCPFVLWAVPDLSDSKVGWHTLLICDQSCRSICWVSGHQLKNSGHCAVRRDENKSISIGPKRYVILLNIAGFSCQSDRSVIVRDSASATTFWTPGRCWAMMWILLSRHHIHRLFAKSTNSNLEMISDKNKRVRSCACALTRRTTYVDVYKSDRILGDCSSQAVDVCQFQFMYYVRVPPHQFLPSLPSPGNLCFVTLEMLIQCGRQGSVV